MSSASRPALANVPPRIVLIGMRASGKTHVAGALAQRLGGVDGAARPLGLERVISGAFGAERVALAVTEPGVLRISEDGGATFRAVRAPSGIPLRVNVVDGEIEKMFVEQDFGDLCPIDPFEVSDADTMMAYLRGK